MSRNIPIAEIPVFGIGERSGSPLPDLSTAPGENRNISLLESTVHSSASTFTITIDDSNSETESNGRSDGRVFNVDGSEPSEVNVSENSPVADVENQWEENDPAPNLNSVIIIERESDIVQEPSVVTIPESPNIGVENPIIRLENPDYEPTEISDAEVMNCMGGKRSYIAMMSDEDDGQTCPVCLEYWTSFGVHRLCSLKCGHLFGKSCISRWLSLEKKKYCPQCNKKASAHDIRDLYATRLTAVDAAEKIRLENELEEVKGEKKQLELQILRSNARLEDYKQQLEVLKARLAKWEEDDKDGRNIPGLKTHPAVPAKILKFHLERAFEIHEGSCRVAAFSSHIETLVVSHQIRAPLLRGYGVKKISKIGTEYYGHNFIFLHVKAIRDLCFHPTTTNLMLSVSFDKTAKLSNVEDRTIVQTFKTNYALWCCCWDEDDSNVFYVGASNGAVLVYDRRHHNAPVMCLNSVEDPGAVVALRYAPAKSSRKGVVICCRLNSVVLYEKISYSEYHTIPLPMLIGPFFSLTYDSNTEHLLVSSRPSSENVKVKHMYCELAGTTLNKIFAFYGGNRQTLLCRSCFIPMIGGALVAAFQEDTNSVELWSTATGSRFQSIPINDGVSDLVSIKTPSKNFLGIVSSSTMRFYQGPT